MTPAMISQITDEELGRRPKDSTMDVHFFQVMMNRILARVLCPAPPPSPSPDATEKGGDRAREMAEKMIVDLENNCFSFKGIDGKICVPTENYKLSLPMIRDLRAWLADALRAYGDELLVKAADNAWAVEVSLSHRRQIRERILALKSSATKGATNG